MSGAHGEAGGSCRHKENKTALIGVGVGIGIEVEKRIGMAFGHEKLDVLRAAIEYVDWKRTGRIESTPIPIPTPK